jgi:GNAT superfamily N-acetyltransferase
MQIEIRALRERDLAEAGRIFRLAFGTFLGLPDPMSFAPGADLIGTRWRAASHHAVFGAFDGEVLIGSNCVANWGSFGFFGPLTIRPDHWNKGVARQLLEATMSTFGRWGTPHAGLFTFPQSPKHLALYQKYDFWPQHLTALLAKPPAPTSPSLPAFAGSKQELLAQAREVTEAVFPGLDLGGEITALLDQQLGEIVTVLEGGRIAAFAICHIGAGSEAGTGAAYLKFAAARPGRAAAFRALIGACEAVAVRRGAQVLLAGANSSCHTAYRLLPELGFRTQITGVAMQRGNSAGYLLPDALVLSDWR